jgi:ubiquinone/menaquinone biosynthesis C-methylase UbiE
MPHPIVLTKNDIERVFDGAAATYDRVGPAIFATFARRLVQDIPFTPGTRVLDVATGTGAVLAEVVTRVGPEGHVVGVDLSEGILREAERAVAAAGLKNVELRRMDAEQLEFPDSSFDAVACAFALFMLPDMNAALREMYRVCKPGGCVAVTYFTRTPTPFDPAWPIFAELCNEYRIAMRMPQKLGMTAEELEAALSHCGFDSVSTRVEVYDLVYPTAGDWWAFMLTMGSRAAIMGMNEETRARFRADYLARLAPVLCEDGYHMSTGVIYAVAIRPRE